LPSAQQAAPKSKKPAAAQLRQPETRREALRVKPGYSLDQRRKLLPYKNPEDFEKVVEGLRKAGLPAE
jgi:hypothetical protein